MASRTSARVLRWMIACCIALGANFDAPAALPDPVRFGVSVEAGDLQSARNWLQEGLPPDFLADRIGTGLMIAAWEGNIPMMALFVEHGARIDAVNGFDEQALQLAAWRGRIEAVRWLLEHGAAVNRPGRKWGALHYAAFAGHRDVVDLLLRQGGDVNARSPNGSTALMMAAREGREEVAGALMASGADPRLANDVGETALVWAMRHGRLRVAQVISSPQEFALAVRAAPSSFGPATRSVIAPAEVSDILRQLRAAEADGRPTEDLRRRFTAALDSFRRDAEPMAIRGGKLVRSARPRALVITAGRGKDSGERVELVYDKDKKQRSIPELVSAIEAAKARGQSTDALRQALRDSVGLGAAGAP